MDEDDPVSVGFDYHQRTVVVERRRGGHHVLSLDLVALLYQHWLAMSRTGLAQLPAAGPVGPRGLVFVGVAATTAGSRRFKWLPTVAGLPEIDLHGVRHSYAMAGRDAKIDWKALSERIGHSDVAFTMRQYVQTDLEAHRQVATALAELILGGVVPLADSSLGRDNSPDAEA